MNKKKSDICLLIITSIMLVSSTLQAQQLVRYPVTSANSFSSPSIPPTGTASNVTASALSATGLERLNFPIGFNGHFLFKNWQTAAGPVVNDKYFSFTIMPDPGFRIEFNTITYTLASRVTNATWELRSSVDSYTSILGVHTTQPGPDADQYVFTDNLSSLGAQTSPVTFRIYGYKEVTTNYSGLVNNVAMFGGQPGQDVSVTGSVTPVNPPIIVAQPGDQTVISGETVIFATLASGDGLLTYQWFRNGIILSTATSNTLMMTNVMTADAGTYFVEVRNVGGVTRSASATLTVLLPPTPVNPPSIVDQPRDQTVIAGENAIFAILATGNSSMTYQWFRNGIIHSAATNDTLMLTNVMAADAGTYFVEVSNPGGVTRSASATLTVR